MNEETRYTPLSERLNQDVIHDNFIPKYSALASVQPSKLVLTGVWLIFGPMSISAFALPWFLLTGDGDFMAGLLYAILMTLFGVLALAILIIQTRRFLNRDRTH